MTNRLKSTAPAYYRIRLRGRLTEKWSDWFDQMSVSTEGEDTSLTGEVADQAALHGLLNRIHGLNLTLLSLERMDREMKGEK